MKKIVLMLTGLMAMSQMAMAEPTANGCLAQCARR